MSIIKTDICILGGGSGGLSVAAGAVQMGAKVVLCEKHIMGGDCLNYGCVPSKAFIEASRIVKQSSRAEKFGINVTDINVDFSEVNKHIHRTIDTIAVHDSIERFNKLGVRVISEMAEFCDKHTIKAGSQIIKAKYIVIATGSRARIIPIPGLTDVDYLTNETIFQLNEKPNHLVVIGGGPIGCELAQAYNSLGARVSILEAAPKILGPADKSCTQIIKQEFIDSGIDVYEGINIEHIAPNSESKDLKDVHIISDGKKQVIEASHILVATGRIPNIENLALDKADIIYNPKGIEVNKRMRTNQKHIYAIGDIASPFQFTHAAGYQAGIVIQNILFKLPAKVNYNAFPWVIYTSPELAHVGENISTAKSNGAQILELSFKDNDRAQAGLHTNGIIKVAVTKKGNILGVSIVGENAGELISQWTLAIQNKLKIKQMASFIVPYPTLSEINKRVAGSFYTKKLFSPKVRRIVKFLMRWF